MAKKKAKQQKKAKTVPISQKEYLQILISFSERAIDNRSGSIDEFFANQANRLRKQLKELSKNE
jgi:hypothetical protein